MSSLPPGPGGPGFAGPPIPVPARTPESMVCLRGPCRYYWHTVTMADAGNPASSFEPGAEPRQHNHVCLIPAGLSDVESAINDDNVYECNKWDPLDPSDQKLVQLRKRRASYNSKNGKGGK